MTVGNGVAKWVSLAVSLELSLEVRLFALKISKRRNQSVQDKNLAESFVIKVLRLPWLSLRLRSSLQRV